MKTDFPTASAGTSHAPSAAVEKSHSASHTEIRTLPAVDRAGHTIDFLLRAHRDLAAARRLFERAIDLHGVPEKITIDKSGANTAAIVGLCADSGADIEMRQSKYLNNLIEQNHRAIKRVVRPMLGFKSFRCARAIIAGIETMHMIKKGAARLLQRQSLVRR